MNRAIAMLVSSLGMASVVAQTSGGSSMQTITRAGSQKSAAGPADYFTGLVRVDPLFDARGASPSAAYVTFQPRARSAWHTHPAGQQLIVTAGSGFTQQWGGPIEELHVGDVVWCPPGVKHWHGASPGSAMTHIALTNSVGGKNVEWMEKVSDEQYGQAQPSRGGAKTSSADLDAVSPALARYGNTTIAQLWDRPALTPRDRSIATLSALIARNHVVDMPYHFELALDNGVKPRELSEIVTHLAFYSGWGSAASASTVLSEIFTRHGIGREQLPAATPALLPVEQASENARATSVEKLYGAVAPGVVQYTTDVLFLDLWLRPDLAPRDRSLVTISALIATGGVAQFGSHLNRAMDNGFKQSEASELLAHLAFYVGWPNVFSAMPVAKDVFEKRSS